jgi:alkylated DNA nucleotide flippase Atl1
VAGVDEEYVEKVLSLVEQVPAGRVTTYGALAAAVGSGGPRQVGTVMSRYGGPVPWWRVVHADGTPAHCHDGEAVAELRAEAAPLRPSGRVDMAQAMWWPDAPEASGDDLSAPSGGMPG